MNSSSCESHNSPNERVFTVRSFEEATLLSRPNIKQVDAYFELNDCILTSADSEETGECGESTIMMTNRQWEHGTSLLDTSLVQPQRYSTSIWIGVEEVNKEPVRLQKASSFSSGLDLHLVGKDSLDYSIQKRTESFETLNVEKYDKKWTFEDFAAATIAKERLLQENLALKSECDIVREKLCSLEQKLKVSTKERARIQSELHKVQIVAESQERHLKMLECKSKQVRDDADEEFHSTKASLEELTTKMKDETEKYKLEIQELKYERDSLKRDYDLMTQKLSDATQSQRECQDEMTRQQCRVESMDRQLERLREEKECIIDGLKEELSKSNEKILQVNRGRDDEVLSVRAELVSVRAECSSEIRRVTEELSNQLALRLKDKDEIISEANEAKWSLETKISELEHQLTMLRTQKDTKITELNASLFRLKTESEDMLFRKDQEITKLREEFAAKDVTNPKSLSSVELDKESEMSTLKAELKQLKEQLHSKEMEHISHVRKLEADYVTQAEQDRAEFQSKHSSQDRTLKQSVKALDKSDREVDDLKMQLKKCQEEWTNRKTKLQDELVKWKTTYEEIKVSKESDLKEMESTLKEVEDSRDEQIRKMREECDSFKRTSEAAIMSMKDALMKEKAERTKQMGVAEVEGIHYREEIERLKKDCLAVNTRIDMERQEHKKSMEELRQQNATELANVRSNFQLQSDELKNLLMIAENKAEKSTSIRDSANQLLTQKINELQAKLATEQKEREKAVNDADYAIRFVNEDKERQMRLAAEDKQRMKDEMESLERIHREKVTCLEQKVTLLEADKDHLCTQMAVDVTTARDEARREFKGRQKEWSAMRLQFEAEITRLKQEGEKIRDQLREIEQEKSIVNQEVSFELDYTKKEREELVARHALQCADLQNELMRTQEVHKMGLKAAQDRIGNLQEQLYLLQQERNSLRTSLDDILADKNQTDEEKRMMEQTLNQVDQETMD